MQAKSLNFYCQWVVSIVSGLASAVAHGQGVPLVVTERLPLKQAAEGIDGQLEVLTDARLPDTLQAQMWGVSAWDMLLAETDPRYLAFSTQPPRRAVLRIRRQSGELVLVDTVERPLAKVEAARLHRGLRTLLISVDYSSGMGTYTGPVTRLLDWRAGKFQWAMVRFANQPTSQRLELTNSFKARWQLVAVAGQPDQRDILLLACHPGDKLSDFVVDYVRYHFDGTQWRGYQLTRPGYWDAESDFPPERRFPVVPAPRKPTAGAVPK